MPKYYVKIITDDLKVFEQVLTAHNEIAACVLTWERLRIMPKGTTWKVGELGQDDHDDDIYFNGDEIGEAIAKYRKKKR